MRWTQGPSVFAMLAVCASAACTRNAAPAMQPAPVAAQPSATAQPAGVGPSEHECDALITHAVALGIDEEAARGGEPATTEADHEAVRRQLHEELVNGCRALSRDAFRCALDAASLPAMAACPPGGTASAASAQRTPSSSTSNSNVAPGGITPPAPRSP